MYGTVGISDQEALGDFVYCSLSEDGPTFKKQDELQCFKECEGHSELYNPVRGGN